MQDVAGGRRMEDLRRYTEKLERLCHLTADVARLGNERSTLKKIVDTAADLVGVQGAHIALVDKDEQQLYGVISSGRHPQGAPRLKFQLSKSAAAQQALKTCRPVAIENAEDDGRVNPRARDLMGIRGVAYMPLLSGKESFGLLILITRRPHGWTPRELDLAKHFADVASVALENSRLMTRLAETEVRFRSLVEHIPAIVYLCDVEPPFRTRYISPQVSSMLGYPPEEWVNDPDGFCLKIVHPEDVGELLNLTAEAARTSGFATAEYPPVSSTGHLIVAGHLLGFRGENSGTFEIFIQLGAILAVVVLERRRFLDLLRPDRRAGFAGPRGCALLLTTSLPALVAGALVHDWIKDNLFGPATVAWALALGGAALLLVEQLRPATVVQDVDGLGYRQALVIGLFQCLALWPGVSRSGATIVGGLLCGLERRTAAHYSFLAAVPVMAAATLYDLMKSWSHLGAQDIAPFAVGFIVAFLSAYAAMRWLVALLGRFTLRPFAWYRILIAPAVYFLVK